MRPSYRNAGAEAASSNAAKVLAAFVIGMVATFAGALLSSGSPPTWYSVRAANAPAARPSSGPAQQPALATPTRSAGQKSTAEQDPQQPAAAASASPQPNTVPERVDGLAIQPGGMTQMQEWRGGKGQPQRAPVEITSEQAVAQPTLLGSASRMSLPDDILQLLTEWQNATRARDPIRGAACYMPTVDVYFTKSDVDREQVRIIQERLFAQYTQIVRYQISDVQLQRSAADTASVIFRKSWDFRGRHTFFGSERERLVLKHAGSGWKISSEQELQILQAIHR